MAATENCSLYASADDRCAGRRVRWVLQPDGNADRAMHLLVCDRHAASASFADTVARALPYRRPDGVVLTQLRATPETRDLKMDLKIRPPQG